MAKETTAKTFAYLILVGLTILAWGMAFGAIKKDVTHISEQANSNTVKIGKVNDEVNSINQILTRIDTRQEVMIKSLEKIEDKLR